MMLFASNGVEKADGEDEGVSVDTNDEELDTILPDLVIAFEASDEFLMNRIINLTEKEVANTRYSEDNMTTRLSVYRYTDDVTPKFSKSFIDFFSRLHALEILIYSRAFTKAQRTWQSSKSLDNVIFSALWRILHNTALDGCSDHF